MLKEDLLKKLYYLKINLHKEVFEQLLCLCAEYQPTNKFQMGLHKSHSSIFSDGTGSIFVGSEQH